MKKNFISLKKYEKKIKLGFFTSKGGVSKGNYFSLNCSKSSGDLVNNIKKNINLSIKNLKIEDKKLKLINQIHSNKIYDISKKNFQNQFSGDGLLTKDKDIALGVLTADCAPIFLFDKSSNIICCLHAGWKGTLSNITRQGIKKFKSKNIKTQDIIAIIGPCLAFKNFEVDTNFKLQFLKKENLYSNYFKYKNKNKDLFDLRGLINFQLKNEGVKEIHNIRLDTYKKSRLFFSHRRTIHKGKINTGRMINIISFSD